jgi:hypothetical protein
LRGVGGGGRRKENARENKIKIYVEEVRIRKYTESS